jgi:nicotinamidase-related amidase
MIDVRNVFLLVSAVATAAAIFATPSARADNIIAEWASVNAPPVPELKPVTVDPKTTALLMLDFLPGVYCSTKPRCMSALPAMKKLLTEARAKGATVIYSVAGNYSAADILKDVAPVANEPWVKSFSDKFMNTDLEKILKDKGIQTVIVTGTSANGAVLYTGSGAGLRGLKVIVPVDGLSAADLYAEQITVWQLANGPRFGANVTLTKSDMIKF